MNKIGLVVRFIILLLVVSASFTSAFATHIVGGGVTYKCLGNNTYQIQIDIFEDCLNGEPSAIAEDKPAFLGIFANDDSYELQDSIGIQNGTIVDISVPTNFSNACVNNAPKTCLRKVSFIKNYYLPSNSKGYKVVYVRCCRNATIANINRPSEVGATYFCNIPGTQGDFCNNSAVFKNYPPQIICINNPLVYDHSATDPDGDSLSYEFCDAYPGGRPNDPKPFPVPAQIPNPIATGTYGYVPGFTPQQPMAGNPTIQINPNTGQITGTPNLLGRFVVAVCCHEWRNHVLINTVTREFQFVVTNCSKAVVADIPQFSKEFNTYIVECNGYQVRFVNHSIGGFQYNWDFGVPGATSTDFEPTYTYPDTGTYVVKLVVNAGSTCPDSISRIVKVFPTFNANFNDSGLLCPRQPIYFNDMSVATYKPVTDWAWNFGDNSTSTLQNPSHTYAHGGVYNVQLIATTIKGCVDTATQGVSVEVFEPTAGNDTIIVKGSIINFNARGAAQYEWTPADQLNVTDISNPVGTYPDTGHFAYNVHFISPIGCQDNDSIRIWVVGAPSLFVPSAFSPNGDGLNDRLRPLSAGYSQIKFFRVFNRWGQEMFHSDNFSDGWDGKYKGQVCEIGTYFWELRALDRFGKEILIKGDVTLVR